jgi:hypothetical protein
MDRQSEAYTNLIGDVNPMISSHMNTLFRNLVSRGKLKELYMFSMVRGTVDNLPELLTIDDIVIDGKYVEGTTPDQFRKAWVNLTSVLTVNRNDRAGLLQVNDVPKAVSTVVRAFLCMSYNDSKEWLSPKVASFVVEFYTYAMEMVLDRLYNLNYEEAVIPKLLLAWHYAELMVSPDEKTDVPSLLTKAAAVFKGNLTAARLEEILKDIVEYKAGRPMNMDTVVDCIKKFGPARMSNINKANLYRFFAVSSTDNTSMLIAMDYPPYLLHQILKIAAGGKHAILSSVYKTRFSKPQVEKVLNQLVVDKALIEGVKR